MTTHKKTNPTHTPITAFRLGDDHRQLLKTMADSEGRTQTEIMKRALVMYATAGGYRVPKRMKR